MRAKKILVTGATGNIGSQLMKKLAAAGADVRAGVHSFSRADRVRNLGVEIAELDLADRRSLLAGLRDVSRLFIVLPLQPSLPELGHNLIEAAKETGVEYIVHSSGMGADAPEPIRLGRWHRQVEEAVERSGIAFTIIRPNSFMQNYVTQMANSIRSSDAFYLPCGDGRVSLVDVRDIAAVATFLLTGGGHIGKAYNLVGPEALSNYDVAEILSRVLARKITYVDVSEQQAQQSMADAGLPGWLVSALSELYAVQKAGWTSEVSPAIEQLTGMKPIRFAQFARDYSEAFIH